MSKKFKITFERLKEVTQWMQIDIEADSEEEAIEKANKKNIEDNLSDHGKWRDTHEHLDTTNEKIIGVNKKLLNNNPKTK